VLSGRIWQPGRGADAEAGCTLLPLEVPGGLRLRVILLVVATSSLVLVSFLVPLALVLRNFTADRAVSAATFEAQHLAPLVTTLGTNSLRLTVDGLNADNGNSPITVFLPGDRQLGQPANRSSAVDLAAKGRSFTTSTPDGVEVLVAVQGQPGRTAAVIRTFVPNAELRQGVARAWLLLGGLGLGLLALSVVVADQLARSLVRPIVALAHASDLLATGDLTARATVAGPPEVRRAGTGLNRLAVRIGDLLAHERETVADLSHRLRTPLTALRIDAESLRNADEMTQLSADVEAVERTVSEIIRAARRPTGGGAGAACDASLVIAERAAFWWPLAEDQERPMMVDVVPGPVPVRTSGEDLAACTDILLENVFSHTPDGCAFAVKLSRRAGGGAWLVVADDGPGFPDTDPTERGRSTGGSTGLGLDIAQRIAEASGGTLTIGPSTSGGGAVTVGLGPPIAPPGRNRRYRRASDRSQRGDPPQRGDRPERGDRPQHGLPQLGGLPQPDGLPQPGGLPQPSGLTQTDGLPQPGGLSQTDGMPQRRGLVRPGLARVGGLPQGGERGGSAGEWCGGAGEWGGGGPGEWADDRTPWSLHGSSQVDHDARDR
jgi:signal transduction histidine kinase